MARRDSAEDGLNDREAANRGSTELALCVLLQTLEVNRPTATVDPEAMDAVLTRVLSQPGGPAVPAWSRPAA